MKRKPTREENPRCNINVCGDREVAGEKLRLKMLWRIKSLVDKFVEEVKAEVEADVEDRMRKEKEMQIEREQEATEREADWEAELSRREVL